VARPWHPDDVPALFEAIATSVRFGLDGITQRHASRRSSVSSDASILDGRRHLA